MSAVAAALLTAVPAWLAALTLTTYAARHMFTDRLTALGSRTLLGVLATRHALLHPRQPAGLLMLDLDHFKAVNDRHGHRVGDTALRAVAARLAGTVRAAGDIPIRLHGDEFAVWLAPGSNPAERVADYARALAAVPVPTGLGGPVLTVACSVGHAVAAPSTRDGAGLLSELLRRADSAMYTAKNTRRTTALPTTPANPRGRDHRPVA